MADQPEPSSTAAKQSGVDPHLLEILVCPLTKGPLKYVAETHELVSERAGLAYPIRDGIPIMLVDEARKLDDAKPSAPGG
ncbi:MAG TPA: Trm112 family protein [Alphaproteobacteria bacterium]|nr:Trm112 family protein [Alphaproteobacteria bacterium]